MKGTHDLTLFMQLHWKVNRTLRDLEKTIKLRHISSIKMCENLQGESNQSIKSIIIF